MSVALRSYQSVAHDRIFEEFDKGIRSTLLVLPTGTGKTITFGAVARDVIHSGQGRVLVLAHRGELLDQAADSLAALDVETAIEKAERSARGSLFGDPDCVVASVQTMQRARLQSWPRKHFKLIVTDECFPAGTMVDHRPIESIRPGEKVASFNHVTGIPEYREVIRLFCRKPSALLRIHLDNGKTIACTPDHPIYASYQGKEPSYVAAKYLSWYHMVYSTTWPPRDTNDADQAEGMRHLRGDVSAPELEQHHDAPVLSGVQGETAGAAGEGRYHALCGMRGDGGVPWKEGPEPIPDGPGVLLGRLSRSSRREAVLRSDGRDESQARIGQDETQKSDERSRRQGQDEDDTPGDGLEATEAGRQRYGADCHAVATGLDAGLGDGGHRQDGSVGPGGDWNPVSLQDRHCETGSDDRCRGGREQPCDRVSEGARREEGILSAFARVDRVEVLEPGSDGRFGGLCPDGLVYNIEVEGNHNYFAEGLLVHNCHHAPADSYGHIYRHLDPDWHLGVTATADRLDGENLGQVYQSVAFEYSLRQAIEEGWLARLKVVRCETEVDLSAIRTTGGDMNAGDLEDAIRPHVEELANATRQEIGDRRAIVFTPDVGSADAFASALTSLGIRAESIAGDSRDRAEIIDGFRKGRSRVLCNCNLLTEGFDVPFVSAIVLARPTKSRSLFSQMVGRGTRRAHGKDDCLIVDFDWKQLTGKHALISPVELFDTTKMDAEVQDLARQLVESGESPDLMDAIERAEATHVERQRLRIRARERESRYRRVAYDPFAVMDTLGMASRAEAESSLRIKPTDKQIATLEKLGVTDARSMSKRRASQMLDVLFSRMDKGLATMKQVSWCISNGIDPDVARKMTKEEASAKLDEFFGRKAVAR